MYRFLGFFLVASTIVTGADNSGKMLLLSKSASPIAVDGVIDPVWNTADSISEFFQFQPAYGKEPSRRTVAKVLTTDDALYCLMVCYDRRDNIQANTGKLDEFTGDIVSIMLDTFGDRRTAYKLAVTASGVRNDSRLLDDARDRDYNWDGIWFADARVYDWGFVVEMEIPYKSIQYDKNLREWGLDFDRWIAAQREDLYWCAYEENEGQRISKFGRLIFKDFYPTTDGLNLEIYPVGIAKTTYIRDGVYNGDPALGLDILYNPSERLRFQLTANPDFAQIEADPFAFNISRYETYFNERRPFFTEGNEVFMPSGRQRNSGFYRPLELFYPRRIGKKLPDGTEVPLSLGTKAFGRTNEWEYGGFLALTAETDYRDLRGIERTEPRAQYGAARLKRQILGNSSIGTLIVSRRTPGATEGVIDLDGAFRGSNWQLAYQLARSFSATEGGNAASFGFTMMKERFIALIRGRSIGEDFDVSSVGFVPWRGTSEFVGLAGPRWFYPEGSIRSMFIYVGPILNYEKSDAYTDHKILLGFNMQFRDDWGYEINLNAGKSRDRDRTYTSREINLSSWMNLSARWNASVWGGYAHTYNFSRDFLAFYSWSGIWFGWRATHTLEVGTSYNMFIEGNPDGAIEDITYNARPFVSITPINDLNVRLYVDNLFIRSTDRLERIIAGLLFSYNFLPKSWIYFALNEVRDRSIESDILGNQLPRRMHTTDRVAVLKLKYLYYF